MSANRPMIMGNHVFTGNGEFHGMIGGNATVSSGVEVTLNGMVGGNLVIDKDAIVHLAGVVGGDTVNRGGSIVSRA